MGNFVLDEVTEDRLKKNMEEKVGTSLSQVKKQKKDLQRQMSKPRYLESQGAEGRCRCQETTAALHDDTYPPTAMQMQLRRSARSCSCGHTVREFELLSPLQTRGNQTPLSKISLGTCLDRNMAS